jgi:hypothetical protein
LTVTISWVMMFSLCHASKKIKKGSTANLGETTKRSYNF